MGQTQGRTAKDLEQMYKNYQKKKEQKKVGTQQTVKGRCDVCEQQKAGLKSAYGHQACSSCRILMTGVKKRPESVVRYMQEVHGTRYFPALKSNDTDNDQRLATDVILGIRHALGIDDGVVVGDLPGRVQGLVLRMGTLREDLQDKKQKVLELTNDLAAQADIIKDLTSPALLPDDISETGADIVMKCDMLKKMLVEKNKSYGDSALDPVRVFSRADPEEQLLVRIDDKLSRLSRGKEFAGDDTVMDLIGYLVLLLVRRDRADIKMKEAA